MGLDRDASANDRCNALFYDWQFSGDNEEYLDPARYQYREFFILVDALFEGKPVAYCPYIFVDNDAAIAQLGATVGALPGVIVLQNSDPNFSFRGGATAVVTIQG